MTRRSIVAALLTLAGFGLPVCAQDDAPPADPAVRVAKAIEDYRAAQGSDRQRAAQRRRTIVWLGEIDHADATSFLQQELAAAADSPFAANVLEAIGKVPRPQLRDDVLAVLHRETAPANVKKQAAATMVRLGERGIDELLELAAAGDEKAKPAVRDAAVAALIDSKLDRALRGLAQQLLTGPVPARLKLLRRMEAVSGVPPVSASRLQLVHEGDLELSAVAWRQLAVEKHERAKALTIDVLERVVGEPRPAIAAELIGGLVRVRDADFYPSVLRFGAMPGDVVKKALRAAAPAAAEDPALVQFLVAKGLEDPRPAAREAAKLLLREAPAAAVQPLVERIRADLRAGKKKAQEMAANLHELLAKDPTWSTDLVALALANDLESRLLGLSLLLEIGAHAGIPAALEGLDHRAWELRSLSYRYLTRCRDVTSIPRLIARVGREEGRLAQELDQALFAHTGTRCLQRKEWDAWWQKHRNGFVLPHAETVRTGGGGSGGRTVAYHDIPVVSDRICFVVDRSGSMREPLGTDKGRTRLDAAKEQLIQVVTALPATHHVNLIAYETGVQPLWAELRPLADDNRAGLLVVAQALPLGGGTNIFDALEMAFRDPKVDTIYLLTDGQPTEGAVRDPTAIVEEVQRWNRLRQVVIHCIGLGIDSDLLKRLAATSGGSYKHVK